MRISDWISDVCSSDLAPREAEAMPAKSKVAAPRAVAAEAGEDMIPARKPNAPDDLIGMKAMGVTREDVREARAGGGSSDPDVLIAGKAVGGSPAYITRTCTVIEIGRASCVDRGYQYE